MAVLAAMPSASAWSQDLPAIVARINGTAVTRAQFEARLAQSRSMNPERFDHMTAVERNQAMLRTLNSIVVREIEVQEARKRGITVADEELEPLLHELETQARTSGGMEKLLAEFSTTLDEWT
ncbi:MAG: SurA N-terminal domain-containing protein, partial [Acidobacteria bacterium]|nr:SurA N-terminal domain-containing protein [Acidobacteriota bacterium]